MKRTNSRTHKRKTKKSRLCNVHLLWTLLQSIATYNLFDRSWLHAWWRRIRRHLHIVFYVCIALIYARRAYIGPTYLVIRLAFNDVARDDAVCQWRNGVQFIIAQVWIGKKIMVNLSMRDNQHIFKGTLEIPQVQHPFDSRALKCDRVKFFLHLTSLRNINIFEINTNNIESI